jgi:hypothetical protein
MAEILNKQYYDDSGRNALIADLQTLWGFEKVEDDGTTAKLWINDKTYINIRIANHNPLVSLRHKGMTVGAEMGNTNGYSHVQSTLYAVKTNSATLLCFDTSSSTNVSWSGSSVIVLGYATNHRRGDISPVAAMLYYQNSGYNKYICADDTSDTAISFSSSISVETNEKITVIEPFTAYDTATSLNDVYICKKTQMSSLFKGDCTINGRSFYSFGWIFVDDK